MAVISHHSEFCIAGMTRRSAMAAVLITPHFTFAGIL
jgi:hypothetical protein